MNECCSTSVAAKEQRLRTLLQLLEVFVGKDRSTSVEGNGELRSFDDILQLRLSEFGRLAAENIDDLILQRENDIKVVETATVSEHGDFTASSFKQFVSKILGILFAIQNEIVFLSKSDSPQDQKDLLGLKDLGIVHSALEVVVLFGLCQFFQAGVGWPIEKRSRAATFLPSLENFRTSDRNHFIFCTRHLCILALDKRPSIYTSIAQLILQRYLSDIYAALIQIVYGPTFETQNQNSEPDVPSRPKIPQSPADISSVRIEERSTLSQTKKEDQERTEFAALFEDLYNSADPALTMEALSVLLRPPKASPPRWLSSVCGRYLSQIVLRKNGIRIVLEFMLGGDEHVNINHIYQASKLVLSVPKQFTSVEEYYNHISPQLLHLISAPETTISQYTLQACRYITSQMIIRYPEVGKSCLIDKITSPLIKYYKSHRSPVNDASIDHNIIISDESEVTNCLQTLHRLLVGSEPNHILMNSISGVIPPLFHLYDFASESKSFLKGTAEDILTVYLKLADSKDSLRSLEEIAFGTLDNDVSKTVAVFAPGSSAGIVIRSGKLSPRNPHTDDQSAHKLIDLLATVSNEDLSAEFFLLLLNDYSLLNESEHVSPRRMLTLLQMILSMIDKLGPSILKKPSQIIIFAHSTLDIDDRSEIDEESISLALSLVSALLSGPVDTINFDDDSERLLDQISSKLDKLTKSSDSPEIHQTVRTLKVSIQAYNIEKLARAKSKRKLEPLEGDWKQFRLALEEIKDEMIPVQAHGMAILRDLVLKKDKAAQENLDQIITMFIDMLKNEDSYLYLNAIKGLSSLTDAYPEQTIKQLLTLYSDLKQLTLDHRLRIGEAILQTVRRAGPVFAKYTPEYLPHLFTTLRDPNSTIRASSLSILSHAIEKAPLAFTIHYHDIIDYVITLFNLEKDTQIRRAAAYLIYTLFNSLSTETLKLIPGDLLLRLYRTLKIVGTLEQDEMCKGHARVALGVLDEIVRSGLLGNVEG
ncbi:hypothetical protein BKA69DRAFT_1124485 [Paraphysoderma sedebokerense]|nr:hypothetical protein BKA69DRAFT_1124485 [Paraphysoderma sedebokerense]